ncbi:Aste57867_4646 [Aphanomyces stellatus]|uniref:Aste57867_4646 protein n=1 Tax=Aphanomyces stellatus TaxID=120398 RepID=A0A485KCZ9_9STRA|nr:hypothetical protein As57867_004633 [Aphanomyces stellatus]VFT81749.1 Aste57867_4646 [Aphanomyces stellatus]
MSSFFKNEEKKIHKSAEEGDLATVKRLVKKFDTLVDFKDKNGCTPLYCASKNGHLDVVQFLVAKWAYQPSRLCKDGYTPLYCASQEGHLAVVEFLVARGANINQANRDGETPLYCAFEKGHLAVIKHLVAKGASIDEANIYRDTPLHCASRKGRLTDVLFLVASGVSIDPADTHGETPLIVAAKNGYLDVVRVLVDAGASLVLSNKAGKTPLDTANEKHLEIALYFDETNSKLRALVVPLLTSNKIDVALSTLNQYVPPTGWRNAVDLVWRAVAYMCAGDKESARKDARASIQLGYSKACSAVVDIVVHHGISRLPKYDGKLLVECYAQYLTREMALELLLVDLPVEVQGGQLVQRQHHSYSWTTFMDASYGVDVNIRLRCLESIMNDTKFTMYTQELLRELVFAKDLHGREVVQITDESTRNYSNDRLYYCGRYEIFDGPPVHVSRTAVVVEAYDHGFCAQLQENEKFKAAFNLWDKNGDGLLSKDEFLRYCAQQYGKVKVVLKFMKNADEYHREIENRKNLDAKFVVSFLPSADDATFKGDLKSLRNLGGYSMVNYPHVVAMPAADRSLDDIYRKERPSETERRNLLQQVAEALQYLHSNELVHGDVKKLNVVRVENRLKLIDLDATTTKGEYVGCKFSSGNLPPQLFYKLKSKDEPKLFCEYWKNTESSNPELWQKVRPRNDYVVKTFINPGDQLPYKLVEADPSLDVWAFGVLKYEMYSGEELVPTDNNQDVCDRNLEEAASWTQENLNKRIRSKISNALVCSLLENLLVVEPKNRMSMSSVLDHVYFKDMTHLTPRPCLTWAILILFKLLDIQHHPVRYSMYADDVRKPSVLSELNSKQPTTEIIQAAFDVRVIYQKLISNPETMAFVSDADFNQKLEDICTDVQSLPEHMNHRFMGKALVALLYNPPDVAIKNVAKLVACTRDTKHRWPLFGKFELTTDILAMPNDQQCIVRVTQNLNPSGKWVAKLTNQKNEIEFIKHVHSLGGKITEHVVKCETWGEVQFNDFKCDVVIMEEGKEDCRHRIPHIKSRVFNLIGCLNDIINAIEACHNIGYIHGDIKLENVVFFSASERYKLIDFEQTTEIGTEMKNSCTEEYCPPEMAKYFLGHDESPLLAQKSYDVWCAAVIVLKLFTENNDLLEFRNADDGRAILEIIARDGFSFQESIASTKLSQEEKHLLSKCLFTNPSMRGTLHSLKKILQLRANAEFLLQHIQDETMGDAIIEEAGGNIT